MQSTLPPSNQPKRRRGVGGLLFSLILISLSIFVWMNRQYIADSISFWQFEPSDEIVAISDKTTLTDAGKFAFYSAQPSVDGNRTFNARCDRREQNTAILGCYVGNRIYIFDVTDKRLDGIKEVTAAHEMLHAVYQRLSDSERQQIDRLVEAEYTKLQNDPGFADRMAFYARTEPGERDNELHSIIGTEIKQVSNELEKHYSKYFSDRSKIVDYHSAYIATFASLKSEKETLEKQLDAFNEERKTAVSKYNDDARRLKSDIDSFNDRAENGGFATQAQFNAERTALVGRTSTLENLKKTITTLTSNYNDLVAQYNSSVEQSNELYKSIDSSLAPAPTV